MNRFLARAALIALLHCPWSVSHAADSVQLAVDPLAVTLKGDPMNRVGQPILVEFTIKNVSNDTLLLKNVSIELAPAARDRFDTSKLSCELQQRGEISLQKGASLQQGCRFEMKSPGEDWTWNMLSSYLFAADIRYTVTANVDVLGDFRYYPTLMIKASEASIFIGGFAGALLLAIFVWVQKLIAEPEARLNWGRNLGYTLLLGIRGAIMAIIALLIGQTTQGAGSPVALTVSDFTGGLMIGIFSYPLASWLADTLKIQGVSSAQKAAQEDRPNTPPPQSGGETLTP